MARRVKVDQPANAGPEAILPLTDFRGDPWGTGDENAVAFRAGVMSSPVPAEFAQRMREEGKAASMSVLDGEPLNITDEERAALPALDPNAADDPATYTTGKAKT
jgi:hypothetical protein